MKRYIKLLTVAMFLTCGELSAQTQLATPPPTPRITLNDIASVGTAVATDTEVPGQPPPLENDMRRADPIPGGPMARGTPAAIDNAFGDGAAGPSGCGCGTCGRGTCAGGGCTNGSCTDGGCADGGCADGACEACRLICEPKEPWRLFPCPTRHSVNVRGWVSAGYTANFEDPGSNFNGPVTFNDRDEGQLNQTYLIFERAVDTSYDGWDIGGRVDLLYGTDYRFTLARGLDAEDDFTSSWHSSRFYGLAMPQAYGEVAVDDLSVKVGHFYTIVGYEVVPAPDNFFYSHAYTMQYGEPFTHTGALATWRPNEQLTLAGGATYGWDNFDNVYDDVSFLGGITFSASDGNSKLALALQAGDEEETRGTVRPNDRRTIYSVVYSRSITDRIDWVLQSDHGWQENARGAGETAEWYGLNQYLLYKINCCWTWGTRMEWFRDDDGFRVAPAGDFAALGASTNPASAGGFEGNFCEITTGLNYRPNGNLIVRPELRYDWFDGRANAAGNQPYDDGSSDHQWLTAINIVYLY
jgi:hypothetical protein